jgi:2-keto-4-pentenoate hydratase/2-oxohepta-3-ene-1,7-dioic acid hydratase in catechol pathway
MSVGVPALIAYLSSVCSLAAGDLIFTGTPAGVGAARGRYLTPGDVVTSTAEVIGSMENHCVAPPAPASRAV